MPVNLIKDKIAGKKTIAIKDAEIEDYKKTAGYWFYLGLAYCDAGMYKDAIESFKQAIRIKPDYAEAHYNLGVAYRNLGMYREAIDAYKQAIRIKPEFAEAHYFLGLTYDILKDRGSALEEYKILKNLNPERANKLFNFIYK